ncbi:hypothetical protein GCM10009780_29890 [Actinomadura alba]
MSPARGRGSVRARALGGSARTGARAGRVPRRHGMMAGISELVAKLELYDVPEIREFVDQVKSY